MSDDQAVLDETVEDEAPVDVEVVDEPAVEAAEPAAPEAPAPSTDVLNRLTASGVTVQADNDDAAIAYLAQQQQQFARQERELQEARYYAQQYQQLAPYVEQFRQQVAAQQVQAQQPPPVWNPPAVDQYRRYMGANGQPVEDAPIEAQTAIRAYNDYRAAFVDKFTHDPVSALAPIIQQEAAKVAQQYLAPQMQQVQSEQFQRSYLQQNADLFYEKGADGRPIYNPTTGYGQPSAVGQRFGQILQHVNQLAPNADPRAVVQYGEYLLGLELQNAQLQQQLNGQQAPAAPSPAETRQNFLRQQATRAPNRATAIPVTNDAPAQHPLDSLKNDLRERFKQNGYTGESDLN